MTGGISKLGTALTVIFVALLAALLTQLILVLWRRRLFRHRVHGGAAENHQSLSPSSTPSKELLLYFCIGTDSSISRVDPAAAAASAPPDTAEIEIADLLKFSGPSKILFTIKEEEKEDLESVCSSAEKGQNGKIHRKTRSLEEWLETDRKPPEMAKLPENSPEMAKLPENSPEAVDHCRVDIETTPFSTPYDSPTFFTPSASPASEVGGEQSCVTDKTTSFSGRRNSARF